jgi:hypothetical protein
VSWCISPGQGSWSFIAFQLGQAQLTQPCGEPAQAAMGQDPDRAAALAHDAGHRGDVGAGHRWQRRRSGLVAGAARPASAGRSGPSCARERPVPGSRDGLVADLMATSGAPDAVVRAVERERRRRARPFAFAFGLVAVEGRGVWRVSQGYAVVAAGLLGDQEGYLAWLHRVVRDLA